MVEYRFRLTGVPPAQAIKEIELTPETSVREAKKVIQQEYELNPILALQFIFKGQVLQDNLLFAKTGVGQTDIVTVMATQAGGFNY